MAIVEAIVYAVVQGVTELLPISSSGYTSLTAWALGWTPPPVSFVAAIHLGSMLALITFFRRDWMFLLRAAMRRRRISLGGDDDLNALRQLELRRRIGDNRPRLGNRIAMPSRQLLLAALIGTLPTLAVGPILYPWLSDGSDLSAQVIGGMLVVSSGLLVAGHYFNFARVTGKDSRSRRSGITGIDAVFIGVAQALALIPGISRSAATITAGLSRGFPAVAAVRFSFLLATPAIVAATAYAIGRTVLVSGFGGIDWGVYAIGTATAFITSFLAVAGFMRAIRTLGTGTLLPFAVLTATTGSIAIFADYFG